MINPLSLNPWTRDNYGEYDALAIALLGEVAFEDCFQPKIYRVPDLTQEVLPQQQYIESTVRITPGSIIYAFYNPQVTVAPTYAVQMTDVSLNRKLFSDPVPALFLANPLKFDMPNLIPPYPVTGSGLFAVEFWNQLTTGPVNIQLLLGVLENIG